jgi:death on curing protein
LISTLPAHLTGGWRSSPPVSLSATEKTSPSLPTSEKGPVEPLISLDWLVWMHAVAIQEFGGSPGIRDRGLLESAIARPLATFGGRNLYETPFKRAAAVAESLVLNHGFVDGNKRTAMYAMAAWLEREGYVIEAARGELRDLALSIASRELNIDQVVAWLVERSDLSRRSGQPRG